MAMALTCHQLGLKAQIFESVAHLKALGVGINLQPNAVRELFDLGLNDLLADIGIAGRRMGTIYPKRRTSVGGAARFSGGLQVATILCTPWQTANGAFSRRERAPG